MVIENVKNEVTIIGFVTATEWDNNDNAVAIEIFTDDDNYRVDNNKQGQELFDFLDEEVEVTGFTREDRDGGKWIFATSYEGLDEEDGEEYDDYEEYGEYDEYDEEDEDDEYDFEAEGKY